MIQGGSDPSEEEWLSRGVPGFSGAAARRGRVAARLTADQLALELGVAEQTVLRWERGAALPAADHLGALAAALNLTVNDLLPRLALRAPTLRDLRHFSGLTIKATAQRSHQLSASAVVRLERGVAALGDRAAEALATAYGVSPNKVRAAYQATQQLRQKPASRR